MRSKGRIGARHMREKSGPLPEPASKQLLVSLEDPLQNDDQTDDCKHSPYDSHV